MKKREQSKDSQIRCKGKAIILQLDAARKQLGTFRSKESKHKHIIHRNREQILFVIVDRRIGQVALLRDYLSQGPGLTL